MNRIAKEVGSRAKAFKLVKHDKKLVRFFLPLEPKNSDDTVSSVIRTGKDTKRNPKDKYQEKLGQELTTYLRDIADENSLLKGIIDRIDFNATTHGVRDLDDDRLSNLKSAELPNASMHQIEPPLPSLFAAFLGRFFSHEPCSSVKCHPLH